MFRIEKFLEKYVQESFFLLFSSLTKPTTNFFVIF